jgi:renal tumor antigen
MKCYKGLRYLHQNDFVHRDIKPENILLRSRDKQLKIGDFGTTCHVSEGQPHVQYVATRWYRSPECMLTRGYYGKKMDIWAMGCVIYEMVMGHVMFCGVDEADQMERIGWVLGRPNSSLINKFRKNKSNVFTWLYESSRSDQNFDFGCGLRTVYQPHMPAYEVLKDMIVYDPARRFSANRLLRKPYFNEIRNTSYHRKVVEFEKSLGDNDGTTADGSPKRIK